MLEVDKKFGSVMQNISLASHRQFRKCSFCKEELPNTEEFFEKSGDNWGTLLTGCRSCVSTIRAKNENNKF